MRCVHKKLYNFIFSHKYHTLALLKNNTRIFKFKKNIPNFVRGIKKTLLISMCKLQKVHDTHTSLVFILIL